MTSPSPTLPLAGKVALVTGASRGIGRAIAARLAADGARLLLTARDTAALNAAAAAMPAIAQPAVAALDLRVPDAATKLVEAALKAHGGIDILVNVAGATKRGAFLSLSDDDWADGFALKFFGAMRLTRAAWPHLAARRGSVVFIAGAGGRTPGAEFALGGSVNAALQCLTKALADLGIADGVQVNVVNPGMIRTERWQRRAESEARESGVPLADIEARMVANSRTIRIGEPEEVAALVAHIVSPLGRFLQGSSIDIDGGATKTL